MSSAIEDKARRGRTAGHAATASVPRSRAHRPRDVSARRAATPSRPVPRPASRPAATAQPPRMPFVLLVLALLGGALVVLLALRTVLTEDAFEIGELQRENRELSHEQQRLQELVVQAESPDALARQAEELGMVPGEAPQFIDTRTGEVRGGDEGGADSGLPGTGDPGEVDGEAR